MKHFQIELLVYQVLDITNIANQAKINGIQNNNKENTLRESDIQEAIDEVMIVEKNEKES